jgi:formin-binding protein 1
MILSNKTIENVQVGLLNKLIKVLLHAQALTGCHFERLKSHTISVETALGNVDPAKDQELFIEYNIRPFSPLNDWVFEPCSSHYDTVCTVFFSTCSPFI